MVRGASSEAERKIVSILKVLGLVPDALELRNLSRILLVNFLRFLRSDSWSPWRDSNPRPAA